MAATHALNADLRAAVQQQDVYIATSQSSFSGYVNSRASSPLETSIHLDSDWTQRRRTLLAMKDQKIAVAHRFLTERTRHMNPFKRSCEVNTFETDEGDVCTMKVDVTPFEGADGSVSVRSVFDALQFYFANMEISKTELSGKVTVRENSDPLGLDYDNSDGSNTNSSLMQHRVVTSEERGVAQESNVVVFYDTSGLDASVEAQGQCVIMTGDFVDQDDLYPYRPHERLRKDATSVMKLSAHRRPRQRQQLQADRGDTEEVNDELVVVLTRWFFVRLHRPQVDVPSDVLQSISDEMSDGIDVMIKSARGHMQQLHSNAS
ncbi:hypothetical protein Gpo141_00012440 [Globisporangium polare]